MKHVNIAQYHPAHAVNMQKKVCSASICVAIKALLWPADVTVGQCDEKADHHYEPYTSILKTNSNWRRKPSSTPNKSGFDILFDNTFLSLTGFCIFFSFLYVQSFIFRLTREKTKQRNATKIEDKSFLMWTTNQSCMARKQEEQTDWMWSRVFLKMFLIGVSH